MAMQMKHLKHLGILDQKKETSENSDTRRWDSLNVFNKDFMRFCLCKLANLRFYPLVSIWSFSKNTKLSILK